MNNLGFNRGRGTSTRNLHLPSRSTISYSALPMTMKSTMKLLPALCLLALTPNAVLGACNADNVLRALQRSSAQASPFCSTYTQPPPNQPLPTYVSQYPASRVSSACSCLITSTPTPTPDACKSDRIINGNFETLVNYQATSWNFPGQVVNPSNSTLYTVAITSSNRTDDNVHFA